MENFLPKPRLKTKKERIRGKRILVTFYTDEKLKNRLQKWATEHDMSLSQALRMGMKSILRKK